MEDEHYEILRKTSLFGHSERIYDPCMRDDHGVAGTNEDFCGVSFESTSGDSVKGSVHQF